MEYGDAFMLQFESRDVTFHYINGWYLDTAARGRPVSLDEIIAVGPAHLGLTPRLTQRVEKRRRQWHWVDDDTFDITQHVDERTVDGEDGLAALIGELGGTHLDRSRPLWKVTLVHGLPDGRQAVLARIHHSMMDGLAAANLFRELSTDTYGAAPVIVDRSAPTPAPRAPLPKRWAHVARLLRKQRARTKEFGPGASIPRKFLPRTKVNPKVGQPERVWAGSTIATEDLQELGGLLDMNVMGALHAAIAQAVRTYLRENDALPQHRMVANFGTVENVRDPRCDGNIVATARVWMPIDVEDPLELARLTAESCRDALALRRHRGMDLQLAAVEFGWIIPILHKLFGNVSPVTPVHLHTAFIVDPSEPRYFYDVEAVGWISSAVPVPPAALSISVHRFAGRMWVGAVATPSAMPDIAHFLDLVGQSLEHLLELARSRHSSEAG